MEKKLLDLEKHLQKLYNLENKNVAFYNREVYEIQLEIYKIKKLIEAGQK